MAEASTVMQKATGSAPSPLCKVRRTGCQGTTLRQPCHEVMHTGEGRGKRTVTSRPVWARHSKIQVWYDGEGLLIPVLGR